MEFPADGFVVVGENGQGKTNLLEAAYYLSLLRSVRGARDVDVVRFGANGFFVDGHLCVPDAHEISVGFERAGRRKRVRRDGVVVDRISDALGTLPAVMFSPQDVALVAGPPSARRRFLDIMLALSSRGYLHALQHYRAALDRRNAALRDAAKHGTRDGSTTAIAVWETPLAEHGAQLLLARRAWVEHARDRFARRCAAVGERGEIALRYATTLQTTRDVLSARLSLAESLAAKRASDLRYGLTQAGPHRDDVVMLLDGHELRTFGSAGQQRTAAIALRTLEAETLREARGVSPIFLLDDPFAELDAGRAARVLSLLSDVGLGQTVLAVPRDSDIPNELTQLPRSRVSAGRVAFSTR